MFDPKVSVRTPGITEFFEVNPLVGPEEISEVGSGSQRERFGWNWLLVLTKGNELRIFREHPPLSGVWREMTSSPLLPPVFREPLPEGARRVSGVFDQSGRLLVAFEVNERVLVTRWDSAANNYVQDEFLGVNPAVTSDQLSGLRVEASDVLVFYQKPSDLSQVFCRVQRELFLDEHVVWNGGVGPIILDKAVVNSLTLELFVSDAEGNVIPVPGGEFGVLVSDYYPRVVHDPVILRAEPTRAEYASNTLLVNVFDSVILRARAVNEDNLTGEPIVQATPAGELDSLERLRGLVTQSAPSLSPTGWPVCEMQGSVSLPRAGIGGSGEEWGVNQHADFNFDVIIGSRNIPAEERYGVRSIDISFELAWVITRHDGGYLDPVQEITGAGASECNFGATWQAGPRTVVVEVGMSTGPTADGVDSWVEAGRFTDSPGDAPVTVRSYGTTFEGSYLSNDYYPYLLVRLRTLNPSGVDGNRNSTNVYVLGGVGVQFNALTNAYVSNLLQLSIVDPVLLSVQPTIARYEDNLTTVPVPDLVLIDVEPTLGEHVHYIVAWPKPVDSVLLRVSPTVAEYRRV